MWRMTERMWPLCTGVLIGVLLSLLDGCQTTRYVTVPEVHHDTVRIVESRRDSVWLHDSVFVSESLRGDTVVLTTVRWRTQYRDRWRTDTVVRVRVDSVPYAVEVVKEVERRLSWWQQTRLHAGELLLALLAAGSAWGLWRLWRRIG